MTEVKPGQIWRNVYGAHLVVTRWQSGDARGAFCDERGSRVGGGIDLHFPPDSEARFPGPLWTLVGEAEWAA